MPSEVSRVSGDRSVKELELELAEAREQQAATAEILRVISSSPTDAERMFAEIAASAARLCQAYDAVIRQVDDDALLLVAHHGPLPVAGALPLMRGHLVLRAVLERRTIHVADLQAETDEYPEGSDIARRLGFRTNLTVPLIRAGAAIGVINVRRTEVRPFTDRQIELLKTFADQAVIAIENAGLFEAQQASKRELQESLEYQTATSEVLSVISRSPNDLQPVLDTISATAGKLCEADDAHVLMLQEDKFHLVAHNQSDPKVVAWFHANPFGIEDPGSVSARAARQQCSVHVHDVRADPDFGVGSPITFSNGRSVLSVPLLRAGTVVGVVTVSRRTVRPFTDRQIALVQTFAHQADRHREHSSV
jgi:GAF domain-containing protein